MSSDAWTLQQHKLYVPQYSSQGGAGVLGRSKKNTLGRSEDARRAKQNIEAAIEPCGGSVFRSRDFISKGEYLSNSEHTVSLQK